MSANLPTNPYKGKKLQLQKLPVSVVETLIEGDSVDTLTLDVPAFIRALEKAREDFKKDEDIHNFVQKLLAKKGQVITTVDL